MPSRRLLPLVSIVCVVSASAEPLFLSGPASLRAGSTSISAIAGGDYDGDGNHDFLAVEPRRAIAVSLGRGDGAFEAPVETAMAFVGSQIAQFDIDGDGDLDLALTGATEHEIALFMNAGDGRFRYTHSLPCSGSVGSLGFHDFTGDGNADLLTMSSAGIAVFAGDGHGDFGPERLTARTMTDARFAAGHLNPSQDRFLDLYAVSSASALTSEWFGRGDGTFRPGNYYGDSARALSVDLDGDGLDECIRGGGQSVTIGRGTGFMCGQTAFASAGASISDLAAADMDGDGRLDLVAGSQLSGTATILRHRGGLEFETIGPFLTGAGTRGFVIADFDGDGHRDVLSLDDGDRGTVSLLRGNGNGSLQSPPAFALDNLAISHLHVADVDRDGHLDVSMMTRDSRPRIFVTTLWGTGDGAFGRRTHVQAGSGFDLPTYAFGDFNGDGIRDLIAIEESLDRGLLTLHAGHGDGTFTASSQYQSVAIGNTYVADVTGDGIDDVIRDGIGEYEQQRITVYRGDRSGRFQPGLLSGRAPAEGHCVTGHVNRDTVIDLVCGTESVFLADGRGTFTQAADAEEDQEIGIVLGVADLDADRNGDLVVWNDGNLLLHRGRGDGTFETGNVFHAAGLFPGTGTPPAVTWADIDADGRVDLVYGTGVLYGDGRGSFDRAEHLRDSAVVDLAAVDIDGNGTIDIIATPGSGETLEVTLTAPQPAGEVGTAVTVDAPPVAFPSPSTITAQVTAGSRFALQGIVKFTSSGETLGMARVDAAGRAGLTLPFDPAARSIEATYLPTNRFAAGSAATTHQVSKGQVTLSLSAIPPRAQAGTNVAFRITSAFSDDAPSWPTGRLTVQTGSTMIGAWDTLPSDEGVVVSTLPLGTHTVTASYAGDDYWNASSATTEVTITRLQPTRAILTTSAPTALAGTPVAIEVFVEGHTGLDTLTLLDGDATIGIVPLRQGVARLDLSFRTPGTHLLRARFLGNATMEPSESNVLPFVVTTRRRAVR